MSKASSNKISELKSLRKGTPSKPQSQDDGVSSNNIPPNSQNEEEEIPQNDEKNKTSSKHLAENNIQNDDKISEIKSINKDLLEKEKEKEEKQSEINNKEIEEKQSEINVKENEEIISQQKKSEIYDGMTEKEKNTLKSAQEDHEINTKEELEKKAKKILMTEVTNVFDTKDLYHFHDLIVPGGKNASLCLVNEPFNKNLRVSDIADHFKFIEPQQVIVLIGANTRRKVKLFAGISRAALNTRAIIIDSGLQTGIEKFCLRKNITLIGIAPENKIEYPKINPEEFSNSLLTNGHTHFILLGKDDKNLNWGQEAKFKVNFAERLANGRKGAYQYKAKVVGIVLGNIPNCTDEVLMFMEKKWPLILVEDSDFCQFIKDSRYAPNEDEANKHGDKVALIGKYSKLNEIDDDSENLAASIHFCLTLSF
jgi:hypothetical protein